MTTGPASSAREVKASRDLAKLGALLQDELAGEPVLRAEFVYANELEMHFGEARPYQHPALASATHGERVLRTFATPWALFPEPEAGFAYAFGLPSGPARRDGRRAPLDRLTEALAVLAGRRVVAASVGENLALFLSFEGGAAWSLLTAVAEPDYDLPAWELTLPSGLYVQAFGPPAPTWSLLDADKPV
jgi:hypothetical protein